MALASRLAALTLGMSIPVIALSQAIPKGDAAFTDYVAAALRQRVGDVVVSVTGPLKLQMGATQLSLARLSDSCRLTPQNCAANVDKFVKGSAELLKAAAAPIDLAALRLVIRTRAYMAHVEAQDPAVTADETEPLPGDLVAVAVVDTPNSMLFVQRSQAARTGLTHEQLFARARDNMHASLAPLLEKAPPAEAGRIRAIEGGDYEVGRIATPADWAPLAQAQHGTLVVALPAPDIVLYLSAADPQAFKALADYSRQIAAKVPNPLAAGLLLRWQDGHWERVSGY